MRFPSAALLSVSLALFGGIDPANAYISGSLVSGRGSRTTAWSHSLSPVSQSRPRISMRKREMWVDFVLVIICIYIYIVLQANTAPSVRIVCHVLPKLSVANEASTVPLFLRFTVRSCDELRKSRALYRRSKINEKFNVQGAIYLSHAPQDTYFQKWIQIQTHLIVSRGMFSQLST